MDCRIVVGLMVPAPAAKIILRQFQYAVRVTNNAGDPGKVVVFIRRTASANRVGRKSS